MQSRCHYARALAAVCYCALQACMLGALLLACPCYYSCSCSCLRTSVLRRTYVLRPVTCMHDHMSSRPMHACMSFLGDVLLLLQLDDPG